MCYNHVAILQENLKFKIRDLYCTCCVSPARRVALDQGHHITCFPCQSDCQAPAGAHGTEPLGSAFTLKKPRRTRSLPATHSGVIVFIP